MDREILRIREGKSQDRSRTAIGDRQAQRAANTTEQHAFHQHLADQTSAGGS